MINGVNRPKDVGTFQFRQLFYGCEHRISAAGDFAPVLKTYTKDSERRINNKIDLLLSLKKKGIWLVDSSIVALYDNEKRPRKPNADTIESAIRASWEGYTRDVIKDAQPEHIICVGKGIHKVLGHDIETLVRKNRVISQPNTRPNKRGPSPLDNLKECSAVCCQVCRVG